MHTLGCRDVALSKNLGASSNIAGIICPPTPSCIPGLGRFLDQEFEFYIRVASENTLKIVRFLTTAQHNENTYFTSKQCMDTLNDKGICRDICRSFSKALPAK